MLGERRPRTASLDAVKLMFHLAASQLTITEESAKRLSTVQWDRNQTVKSWGGKSNSRISSKNGLRIGSQTWRDLMILETVHSGPGTDGKFGPDAFDGLAIEINYDRKQLVLHSSTPNIVANYEKRPLISKKGQLFIDGTIQVGDREHTEQFLLHTGYGGQILFSDDFARKHKLAEQIEITDRQELKDSFGNAVQINQGVLPKLSIGRLHFPDKEIGFFAGKIGNQTTSLIGAGFLKATNLVIGPERKFIYLQTRMTDEIE